MCMSLPYMIVVVAVIAAAKMMWIMMMAMRISRDKLKLLFKYIIKLSAFSMYIPLTEQKLHDIA